VLRDAIDHATQPYPEHRCTAAELHGELTGALHTSERQIVPRIIASLGEIAAPCG
jgi:hypothetical protein